MNATEADQNTSDQLAHAAPHDPECQRILDLCAGQPSPWVSVGELHRYLEMPTCHLEPRIVVEHHNMAAKTSRYATLRHLGRSVRRKRLPSEGPVSVGQGSPLLRQGMDRGSGDDASIAKTVSQRAGIHPPRRAEGRTPKLWSLPQGRL